MALFPSGSSANRKLTSEFGSYKSTIHKLHFACDFSMQLAAPQPRRHKVLMSFRYWNAWGVIFFETDRMRTALPRRTRFNSDEALIEFAQRAVG
jgi:hypothetical protein